MAKPKYHVASTLVIFMAVIILYPPQDMWDAFETFIYLFVFGVLADTDHIYGGLIWWTVRFVKHEKVNLPEGWKNRFHTFRALAVIALGSYAVGNYLPILAYAVHMFIDAANRAYDGPWEKNKNSYLPWAIHKFYPRWLPSYLYEEKA